MCHRGIGVCWLFFPLRVNIFCFFVCWVIFPSILDIWVLEDSRFWLNPQMNNILFSFLESLNLVESERVRRLVVSDSLGTHGLQPARLPCPWNSPGKTVAVGCQALVQGIFLSQGSNSCLSHLLHWQADSLPLVPAVWKLDPPSVDCGFMFSKPTLWCRLDLFIMCTTQWPVWDLCSGWLSVVFSPLLCCLKSGLYMNSPEVSPRVHKQLHKIAFLSSLSPVIFLIFLLFLRSTLSSPLARKLGL